MGIRRSGDSISLQPSGVAGASSRPAKRSRKALPTLAFAASMCFVLVAITDPTAAVAMTAEAEPLTVAPVEEGDTQSIVVANVEAAPIARDQFTITAAPPPPPPPPPVAATPAAPGKGGGGGAPAAGTPNPGSAQAIARDMVLARGWGEGEFSCLVSLWKKESSWNTFAENKSSGAYGIPQALPGSKMATAGADWATNPATQITWGLGYITGRYGTPCGAWSHSQAKNWY